MTQFSTRLRHTMLLEGPAGAGKSTCVRTAAGHVKRVLYLTHEPGWEVVFGKDIPGVPKVTFGQEVKGTTFHYKYLPPARPTWRELREAAVKINNLTIEQLQKLTAGINKQSYDQFLQTIDILGNFKCDCCQSSHGAADEWTADTLLVEDGLTAISTMSMDLTTGAKPVKTQPDWGVAMDNLERFIGKCVYDTHCNFLLLGHVGREKDEVSGSIKITTHTLGVKLAPKLVQMFDEVVLARKTSKGYYWSTNEPDADLKCRYLPDRGDIPADLSLLIAERQNV